MNSLKHGLRAKVLALPGEDPAVANARAESWCAYYEPDSPAAHHRAVRKEIDQTLAAWDADREAQVQDLQRRLELEPAAAAAALRATGHGCRYLIARWEALAGQLRHAGQCETPAL